MNREEAKRRLLNIERSLPNTFRTKEDVRNFEALEMAIKALEQNESAEEWYKLFVEKLEQEPCEDTIRRQAVLETLDDADNFLDEDRTIENYKELLKECYEVLPPVNSQKPKWIPVSERLPEIDEPVLIFQRYYSGANITIGRYHSDEDQGGYRYWQWIKYDNHFSYGIDHFGIICPDSYYVDAWMPLPEPYKTEGSGEE